MNKAALIATLLLCGLPGSLLCLVGAGLSLMGFLADSAQLYLDTGLQRGKVMAFGLAGLGIGVLLVAIPIIAWLLRKPAQ